MCQLKSWYAFLADVVSAALAWRRNRIPCSSANEQKAGRRRGSRWWEMGRARQTCIGAGAIGGVDRLKVERGPAGLCKSRLVPMSSSRRSALFPTSIAQTFHLFPHNLILNTALFPGCLVPHPFLVGFLRLAGVCLISAVDLQHPLVCVFAPCVVVSGKSLHHSLRPLNSPTSKCMVWFLPSPLPVRLLHRSRQLPGSMRCPWPCRVIKLPKTSYLRPRHARFDFVPLVIHCALMLTHSMKQS